MPLHLVDYPFPASCNFFLDFSVAKLHRYNELLSKIETENKNLAKCDLSLSANSMVYHNGVCATIRTIPGPIIGNQGVVLKKD